MFWRDTLFENLIDHTLQEVKKQVKISKQISSILIDPLDVDAWSNVRPIVDYRMPKFSANLKMWNISVYGLSDFCVNEILVTRAKNLFDIDVKIIFKFKKLSVKGMYNLIAYLYYDITSHGDQSFSVDIDEAVVTMRIRIDHNRKDTGTTPTCAGKLGDVIITKIETPISYEKIAFNMKNLESMDLTIINLLTPTLWEMQEDTLESIIKESLSSTLYNIIC